MNYSKKPEYLVDPATGCVMYCARCRNLIGSRWFVIDGVNVCPQCNEDIRPPADTRDVEHDVAVAEIAALRSLVESLEEVKADQKARIATLEAQVEQAREALERLLRSARRPECCWECHKGGQCQATDYIGSDCEPFALGCAALQALREGGKGQ